MSVVKYPGGKTFARKVLEQYIPADTTSIVSPFFGGGSFELTMSKQRNMQIIGNDLEPCVVNLFKVLKYQPTLLINIVQTYYNRYPVPTNAMYSKLKRMCRNFTNPHFPNVPVAAAYFILNRCSRSGFGLAGGRGCDAEVRKDFNQSSINRLRQFDGSRINLYSDDFETFLDRIPDVEGRMVYGDPPYIMKNKKGASCYGYRGHLHRNFDHVRLRNVLVQRKWWLLSYSDCPEVRELYKGFHIVKVHWRWCIDHSKPSNEVLIFPDAVKNKLSDELHSGCVSCNL